MTRATAAVFALALAARLAFWTIADQPLLYTHQYHYFTNALTIAQHPDALRYVVSSDEWRTWDHNWTIAPLYHLFLAAMFRVAGGSLVPVRAAQCVLDAAVAALVAVLGRRVAGPRGAWAGVPYALYWPAMEMPLWTLTENVHTPLFVAGMALLSADPGPRGSLGAGAVLGLSALARSVSSGFLGLVAAWRWWTAYRSGDGRRGFILGALVACGGAAVILPWTARNFVIVGDHVLIESAAFENLWWANHFTDKAHFARQQEVVHAQTTPAGKRGAALHFALRGLRRDPAALADKVRVNFWHLFRPEGLHTAVAVQRSIGAWRNAGNLLLDDLPLLLALPLFAAFVVGGRPSSTRSLIALWTAYYLLMIVVVFHNEIRYRSALMPFVFAGGAGGLVALAERPRRARAWAGLLGGALVSVGSVWPYAGGAFRAVQAARSLQPALAAVEQGRLAESRSLAEAAASRDPRSPRPWADYGRELGVSGHAAEAAEAYRRAVPLSNFANWRAPLGLSRYDADAAPWTLQLDRASWDADPWMVLEAGWEELPAPLADEVTVGRGDYGAVRGFLHPRGGDPALSAHRQEWTRYEAPGEVPPPGAHRWSRHRAWLRLRPTVSAAAYDVTLDMGAPFPSRLDAPMVRVVANDGATHSFTLDRTVRAYSFRVAIPRGEALIVRLDAPTWSRIGEPADQGVRVDRISIRPVE